MGNSACCKTVAAVFVVCLSFGAIALAEDRVVESAFCLKMDGRECSTPMAANEASLSEIVSVEGGVRRPYFWSKVSVDEGKHIVHVWSYRGTTAKSPTLIHVSKSVKSPGIPSETEDRVREYLQAKSNTDPPANSVQGVYLPVSKSPGFRTYSKIKVQPGEYTVEVYGPDGSVMPGGEAKRIRILP